MKLHGILIQEIEYLKLSRKSVDVKGKWKTKRNIILGTTKSNTKELGDKSEKEKE